MLEIRAGEKALEIIRSRGLRAEDVKVVTGAAGGPKWLVLSGLDRVLFGTFFRNLSSPVYLIGASIGAWRFSAVCRKDPVAAIDRFEEAYIHQQYSPAPSAAEISAEARKIQAKILAGGGVEEILGNPFLRLNVLAARCRGLAAGEKRPAQAAGLIAAFLLNALSRRLLRLVFSRTLFHHPAAFPPVFEKTDGLGICRVPLSRENLAQALLASGSIPMVMQGTADVPGAPAGMYRDGGIVDYHMDLPFSDLGDGLVLFPHYMPRIIPGWFDKRMTWRKPSPAHMRNMVRISPSAEFIASLPGQKIPDRDDFYLYKGRDPERFSDWKKVVGKSKHLADSFMEAAESGKIREIVKLIEL